MSDGLITLSPVRLFARSPDRPIARLPPNCSSGRLEWGKTNPFKNVVGVGGGGGSREDKGIAFEEIEEILPGLTTPIARRSGKGKASYT